MIFLRVDRGVWMMHLAIRGMGHPKGWATPPPAKPAVDLIGRMDWKDGKSTNRIVGDRLVRDCCGRRVCPDCGVVLGIKTRERLLRVAGMFVKPALLTLTVDRKGFAGPEEAYECVSEDNYLSRLLRAMKVTRYFWILEIQQKTGDGWPHWHVLIDLSKYPGGRLPKALLRKIWWLWRDKWGIGGLDLERVRFEDSRHADIASVFDANIHCTG